MKPICVPCKRFYRIERNGFNFIEGKPIQGAPDPGQPEGWEPYKIWTGDLWVCPGCMAQIVVGVPPNNIAEHYEKDFDFQVKQFGADQFTVFDC